MSSKDWYEYELGQLLNFKRGHDLPKNSMVEGKVPVIGSNGIIGYHNIATTNAPCITIGRSGNIGKPLYINSDGWAHNTTLYVEDYKDNYPLYLYYLLKTLDFGHYGGGSAVPTLNRNHIHPIKVYATKNIYEQKAIAGTLSCLDNMIELNNRTNQVLEEIAQTIFKRWFVDFEFPNEDKEPYKSSGGEMVDSELGEIPKGWRVKTLGEFCEIKKGLSYKGKHLSVDGIPMINLGNVQPGGEFRYDKIKYYNGEYKERHIVKNGDIIIANTDITSDRVILGSPIIVPELTKGDIIFTHHLFAFGKLALPKSFLYYYLKSKAFRERAESYVTGTTVLALSKDAILSIKLIIPDDKGFIKFCELTDVLVKLKEANIQETHELETVRDTLLPKLMSGEIRVPVEEVV